MTPPVEMLSLGVPSVFITSVVMYLGAAAVIVIGWSPLKELVLRQEQQFENVLRRRLLLNINPRTATIVAGIDMVLLAGIGYLMTTSFVGVAIGLIAGVLLPSMMLKYLQSRRLAKLNDQLVDGIQTLGSGVRAGLNLAQAMQLVARDGPVPLRQEFHHLVQEYEYGIPLEDAMDNAADRIGSGDFRLLFSALQTHRERGGDLGETLDRIAASIREIQRLENRVKALTAQGRATARWLGAMPVIVLLILNLIIDDSTIRLLFSESLGKVILLAIILLNVVGFLWIRKIVSLDL